MKNNIVIIFAFLSVAGRISLFGASVGDAIAILSLAALYAFFLHLDAHKQAPESAQTRKDIDDLKSSVAAIKIGNAIKGR